LTRLGVCFILLILATAYLGNYAYAQQVFSLELNGFRWDHSELTVVFISGGATSVSLSSARNGFESWYNALQEFAVESPQFEYVAKISFRFLLEGVNTTGSDYDITVSWVESLPNASGICHVEYKAENIVAKAEIKLVETVMAMHEIGHALGLGESNDHQDLMYPIVSMETSDSPSPVDLYGVALSFYWLALGEEWEYEIPKELRYTKNFDESTGKITYVVEPVNLNPTKKEIVTIVAPESTPTESRSEQPKWESWFLIIAGILALFIFVYLAHSSSRHPKPATVSPLFSQPPLVSKIGCPNCGARVTLQDRFCGNCGSPIKTCSACGTANLSNSSYCHSCGRRITP